MQYSAETIFQGIEAAAVVVALGFAIVQVRQYRRDKRREAALELLHSFQSPDFARALNIVYRLPDGLSREEIEQKVGEDLHLVYALTTTWESLGVLVFQGELDLELVGDFFSGPIRLTWQKFGAVLLCEREATGRDTVGEWFQWLNDRLVELEAGEPPIPAHIEHRDWKPGRRR